MAQSSAKQAFGLALIVAAIFLHFCFCTWSSYGRDHLFLFFYARDGITVPVAIFWSFVVPILVAGGGLALYYSGEKRD